MELTLTRYNANDQCTLGKLSINGGFACYTLEDALRDGPKVFGKTAIPAGRYSVIVNWSNRFNRKMPLLVDVPGFTGIRIHPGNTDADTEGCILVGQIASAHAIAKSRAAFDPLFARLSAAFDRHEQIWITIANLKGSVPDAPAAA